MDAWIDCMSYLDGVSAGMTKVHVKNGDILNLEIEGSEKFRKRLPEIFEKLIGGTASVNQRYFERRGSPMVALFFL